MYKVFAGDWYYPSGGWNDWVGSFATLDAADKFTIYYKCQCV